MPEFELIIFVIRMVIKHFTWDTVLLNQGRLSEFEKTELEFLFQRISEDKLLAILNELFSFIDQTVFQNCLKMLILNEALLPKLQKSKRLVECLEPF